MRKEILKPYYTAEEAKRQFDGVRPTYALSRDLDFRFVSGQNIEFREPDGRLIACLVSDVFDETQQEQRFEMFRQIKGNPGNRPEIFGKGARMQRLRKDSTLSPRIGVPLTVANTGGQAVTMGPYRFPPEYAGQIKCEMTGWSLKRPDMYRSAVELAVEVTEFYKAVLPNEYRLQMEYVSSLERQYTIAGSAYTNVYALKDRPTAFHTDEFDIPTATGALTCAGDFAGNEVVVPEFHLAIDLQPSDVLFLDVHRWHGNLPKRSGQRISQVFFVRRGMHECGRQHGAWALYEF